MQNPISAIGTASLSIPASVIVAMLGIIIILLAIAMVAAYRRGHTAGSLVVLAEYRHIVDDQKQIIDNLLQRIDNTGAAMEQLQSRHEKELRAQNKSWQNELDKAAASLGQLRIQLLSETEVELIMAMAEKLRLGSSALHATQQFADARQAKELASRGAILFQRLQPRDAKGEAA